MAAAPVAPSCSVLEDTKSFSGAAWMVSLAVADAPLLSLAVMSTVPTAAALTAYRVYDELVAESVALAFVLDRVTA